MAAEGLSDEDLCAVIMVALAGRKMDETAFTVLTLRMQSLRDRQRRGA